MARTFFIAFILLFAALTAWPERVGAFPEKVPFSVAMKVNRARQLMDKGEIPAALELLQAFAAKQQDSGDAVHYLVDFMLGNGYLAQNDPAQAISYYRSSVAAQPDFTPAWLNLAKSLYDQGQAVEAGHSFLRAYETPDGKEAQTLYYSSACFAAAEDYPQALDLFQQLLKDHPDEVELSWKQTLARIYLMMDQLEEALPHVEALANGLEGEAQKIWQEILVYEYIQLEMMAKATAYAAKLVQLYPVEAKWWKIQAYLFLQQEQYRQALAALTIYSYLSPLTDGEKILLGDVNFMVDIPIQAVRFYEQRLTAGEADTGETGVFKKIVQGYIRLYDSEKALAWLDKGLRRDKDALDLLKLKGYLLYEAAQYKEAATVFKHAARVQPGSGEIWMMAGYTAWQVEQLDAAGMAFDRALTCDGYEKQARTALEQLEKYKSQADIQ